MTTERCYLNAVGILCAAGDSAQAVKENLLAQKVNLTITDKFSKGKPLPLGLHKGGLPAIPMADKKWKSRNNQFALAALKQIEVEVSAAMNKYGAHRIGVIVGTSTSGIAESEPAIREWVNTKQLPDGYDYSLQEMGATAAFIAKILGAQGAVYGISTACSSGAKALAAARRLIRAGICDAVIAGGVDTLCHLTVQGFSSLQAVSDERCNPFSVNRKGINIGEGAALFLVTKEEGGAELLGVGEGSDAHHISAPDPTGNGAIRCMQAALDDAKLMAKDISYVNLHGTATELNDQMEAQAMNAVFGPHTLCGSTKQYTGHTLGAAGAVEAGICWLMLDNTQEMTLLPVHLWDGEVDQKLKKINLVDEQSIIKQPIRYTLSNSFAFGGNNISLLLGRGK